MSIFKKQVKVRFAPSPTGFLHIGGLRTALYNYLFAKKNKAKFILRIEDTDRERYVEGGVENIINTLRAVGIDYNEGPDKGGSNGPYVQSERLPIYKKYVEDLLDTSLAYYCFCTKEELESEREECRKNKLPPKYSGKCSRLSKTEIKKRLEANNSYVVRLKIAEKGSVEFEDLVYGKIKVEKKEIDNQVLLKSDGFPTYHLANVVDDHLMGITHVIRGEEWMPSTPKHILLYEAFGWPLPEFAHLPLLLNPDKSKLSKRQGDVAVEEYLKKGFLPEALINFVALLGWNPKGDQEIYEVKELIKYFDLKSVNKSGAVMSQDKLYWMNGHYIRQKNVEDLTDLLIPYLIETELVKYVDGGLIIQETGEMIKKEWLEKVVISEHERLKRLDEFPGMTEFLFKGSLKYDAEILVWKKSDKKDAKKNLQILLDFLTEFNAKEFTKEKLEKNIKKMIEEKDIKTGNMLWPMRVALSGMISSPPPFDIAELLGKEKILNRLKDAINKL